MALSNLTAPGSKAPHGNPEHHVALFFAATGGGVQRVQVVLANALAARGLRVACIMPQVKGPFVGDISKCVTLIDFATRKPSLVVRRLRNYLRRCPPGILIAAQQHTILAAVVARALAGNHVPLAIVQHNTLSQICRHSRHAAVRWLLPTAARLCFPLADKICAVSHGVADDLESFLGLTRGHTTVLYNPVVGPEIDKLAAEPSGHTWLDAKERPVILGVGSLIENKGFGSLIRAFARLRQQQEARLIILGDGDQRAALFSLARDLGMIADIDLPGFVVNPLAFMARADVFALTSRVEGLPTVIIEALACGCPVVSTNCPHGPDELLEHGAVGQLVAVGDDRALAAALLRTLLRPPDRTRLKERAAAFTVDPAVDRYLALVPQGILPDARA